jgi:hypothetical protein
MENQWFWASHWSSWGALGASWGGLWVIQGAPVVRGNLFFSLLDFSRALFKNYQRVCISAPSWDPVRRPLPVQRPPEFLSRDRV